MTSQEKTELALARADVKRLSAYNPELLSYHERLSLERAKKLIAQAQAEYDRQAEAMERAGYDPQEM